MYLCREAKGMICFTYTQHRSNARPCQMTKILLTPHDQDNLLPINFLLKSPKLTGNGYLTIHLLASFGSKQSVMLSSSSTRTAGHSAAFPSHASEIFGGDLWKQHPRPEDLALAHVAV